MLNYKELQEKYVQNILHPLEEYLYKIRYLYYVKHNTELKPLLDRVEDDFIYFLKKYEELL